MAASNTLPQSSASPQISKLGIIVLYGYGIRIRMQASHLEIEDGIGPERRTFRLPRVGHRLRRLICISEDGFITLSALKWLTEIGASFVMLDRLGKVRIVTGPPSPSEARLRRAQALALGNGSALRIARELISAKLTGQERVLSEQLKNSAVAQSIAQLRSRLTTTESLDAVRGIESRAAAEYWNAWREVPILFPRKEMNRVPSHWLHFGTRHSPLTGGPRLAVNPPNALINYVSAVAESECTLSSSICGLDAAIGFVHTDRSNRNSLALDLIEVVRPSIESWVLDWLMREPLRRSDFVESANGNCRIVSGLCSKLSETAPTWGKLVAPWAEYVVRELWTTVRVGRGKPSLPPTRLTQQHKREVHGRTFAIPIKAGPIISNVCRGCGATTQQGEHCPKCGREISREKLIELAKTGRIVRLRPASRKKQSETQRRHRAAQQAWRLSAKPVWLTRDAYVHQIQPRLSSVTISRLASTLGVCESYAADIRAGRHCPHPRHWRELAELTGIRQ